MKKISGYFKSRTSKLALTLALVFSFVGLPAFGQMAGINAFQSIDALQWGANLLAYYDMDGNWVDDGTDVYYDDTYYDDNYYDPANDPYYEGEKTFPTCSEAGGTTCYDHCNGWWNGEVSDDPYYCCMGSCETYDQVCETYNGIEYRGEETICYDDGSCGWYDFECKYTQTSGPTETYETYEDTYSDEFYGNGTLCSYDGFGVEIYGGAFGCFSDSTGQQYVQEYNEDCSVGASYYDTSRCGGGEYYEDDYNYDESYCGDGCWWDTDHCECDPFYCPDTCWGNYDSTGTWTGCSCPWDDESYYDDYEQENWDDYHYEDEQWDTWDNYHYDPYSEWTNQNDCLNYGGAWFEEGSNQYCYDPYLEGATGPGMGWEDDYQNYDTEDATGPGMGWETDYIEFTEDDFCLFDDFGGWIYSGGLAYNADGSWDKWVMQSTGKCEIVESGQQFDDWSTWNWASDKAADHQTEWDDYWNDGADHYNYEFGNHDFEYKNAYAFEYDMASEYNDWMDHSFDNFMYDYEDDNWAQTVSSSEIRQRKSDFQRQMNDFDFSRDWSRLTNRQSHIAERLSEMIGYLSLEMSMYQVDSMAINLETLEELLEAIERQTAETETIFNLQETDREAVLAKIDNLESGSTWGDIEAIEASLRKVNEGYNVLLTTMHARADAVDMLEMTADMQREISKIKKSYAKAGMDLPNSVEDDLEDIENEIDDLSKYPNRLKDAYDEAKSQVTVMRGLDNMTDIDEAAMKLWDIADEVYDLEQDMRWAFDDFHQEDHWQTIDEHSRNGHMIMQVGDFEQEINMIRQEISSAKSFLNVVQKMNLSAKAENAVNKLITLASDGVDVLNNMAEVVENEDNFIKNPEILDGYWDQMDQFGRAAEMYMEAIMDFIDDNPEEVKNLDDDDQDLIEDMLEWGGPQKEFEDRDYEDFYDNYGFEDHRYDRDKYNSMEEFDYARFELAQSFTTAALTDQDAFNKLVDAITAEVVEKITRNFKESVMEKAMKHIDNKMIELGVNLAGVIDEALVDATADVLEAIESVDIESMVSAHIAENAALADEFDTLKYLHETTSEVMVASEIKDDLKDAWEEVYILTTDENSPEEAELQEVIEDIEDLLEDNRYELIHKEKVSFEDMLVENANDYWYYDEVITARQNGILDGYADGTFGASNEINRAEALKMIMESAGHNEGSTSSGPWYSRYVDAAIDLDMQGTNVAANDTGYWGASATREEVAVWVVEANELNDTYTNEDYENVFPDVSSTHEHAAELQAAYDYGIFMGDSGTGTMRPDDSINRAEVAKVVTTAEENIIEFTSDDLAYVNSNLLVHLNERDSNVIIASEDAKHYEDSEEGLLTLLKGLFTSVFGF